MLVFYKSRMSHTSYDECKRVMVDILVSLVGGNVVCRIDLHAREFSLQCR